MRISKIVGLGAIIVLPILLLVVDLLLLEEEKTFPQHVNPYEQVDVPTMVGPMADVQVMAVAAEKQKGTESYTTVEWMNLIPEWEYEILSRPIPHPVDDPSLIDRIIDNTEINTPFLDDEQYQQALTSVNVIPELDGQSIKIAGFVIPLEFENKRITQFFLVPFYGACIHVPPPPPNQIILVNYPEGMKELDIWDPIWVAGVMKTSLIENELATSAYLLEAHEHEEYIY